MHGRAPQPTRRTLARSVTTAGIALGAIVASTQHAHAQLGSSQLPAVGADPRVGDLRPQLESLLRPSDSPVTRPAWLITPAIETDIGVTDNANRVQAPRRADIFGVVSPQIVVSADTAHIAANLSYAPQFVVYAKDSQQNQVYQTFAGQALVTFIPDALFLDLRGNVSQTSLTGGFNQSQTQTYNAQNSVQQTTFQISPYATHRFGGWGTGTVRYQFARTLQDAQSGNNPATVNTGQDTALTSLYGQPGYGSLNNLSTTVESANFTTGENLGQYNLTVSGEAIQYAGGGASYVGAYRQDATIALAYALSHKLALNANIGYENLSYGGTPGYRLSEGTYGIGFTYTPSPDTKLQVLYGRHDGGNQVDFDAEFAPTARSRIIARYTTGITTNLQQAQSQLNSTTVGAGGLVTDSASGAPVLNNNYNGVQNAVYRDNLFSATLLFLQERDSYSFSIGNEQRTTLTATPTTLGTTLVPAGTSTNTTFASVGWQHDLSPTVALSTTAQYGISTNTGQLIGTGTGNQTTLSFTATLSKQFSETLSGTLRYTYTNQSGNSFNSPNFTGTNNGLNTGSYSENILLVGLHKSF